MTVVKIRSIQHFLAGCVLMRREEVIKNVPRTALSGPRILRTRLSGVQGA